MADHPKPRLLRVFVGDATPQRRGADNGNGNRSGPGAVAAVTVGGAIDTFLVAVDDRSARDRRGRPFDRRTAEDLRWCLTGHVREALGAMPVDAVRRRDIEALLAELADEGVPERRLRAVARALRSLYDFALERHLVGQNPAAAVAPPAEAAPPVASGSVALSAGLSERAISFALRSATVGFLLLALVFLTESL
jgi:hypothetical protein